MRELYQSIKIVKFKDSQPFRQFIFKNLKSRKLAVRLSDTIYHLLPKPIKNIYILSYGILSYLSTPNIENKVKNLGIYSYKNELRQLNFINKSLETKLTLKIIKISPSKFVKNITSVLILILDRRIYSIANLINKKNNNFLVSCRCISTMFYYINFKNKLKNSQIKSIIVSSDSNPYAMGITFAAKSLEINTVYINHGHIPENPPRLIFDHNILDGQALLDTYKRTNNTHSNVIFKGIEGEFSKMEEITKNKSLRVGVFLSLVTDWDSLLKLVTRLSLDKENSQILVRLHPNLIIREIKYVKSLKLIEKVKVSLSETIASDDLNNIDYLIAGNSSVHLTSLKIGVPSIYFDKIDLVPYDFYLFSKLGLVLEMNEMKKVSISELNQFYNSEEWIKVYKYFEGLNPSDKNEQLQFKNKIINLFKEI